MPLLEAVKNTTKDSLTLRQEGEAWQAQKAPAWPGAGLSPASGAWRSYLPTSVLTFPHLLKDRQSKSIFSSHPSSASAKLLPRLGLIWWKFYSGSRWPCPFPREWLTTFGKFLEYSGPSLISVWKVLSRKQNKQLRHRLHPKSWRG